MGVPPPPPPSGPYGDRNGTEESSLVKRSNKFVDFGELVMKLYPIFQESKSLLHYNHTVAVKFSKAETKITTINTRLFKGFSMQNGRQTRVSARGNLEHFGKVYLAQKGT